MTRRWTVAISLLAALGLTAWWVSSRLVEGSLEIGQPELQTRIAPHFPSRHCSLVVACLELANPVVVLTEGEDRVGLNFDVKVSLGSREIPGHVSFSGRPRYVQYEGKFFIDDLQIKDLELTGFPEEYAEVVKVRGPTVAKLALQSHPIYTIDGSTAKGALAKLALRDVKVVNGKLRVTFIKAGA
jgi:hypothetical protein